MEEGLGVSDANGEGAHDNPAERSVASDDDSMSPMRWLLTKCDDVPQSEDTVNFSGPEVADSERNE